MIERQILTNYFNELLTPQKFQDYGPNGLQVEGTQQIKKIAFAVSATIDSIDKAIEQGADTLVVHHGLFWKFQQKTITGAFAKRVKPLILNNLNLYGYHLPLDANIEVGNAISIANFLALKNIVAFGEHKKMPLGVSGTLSPITVSKLKHKLEKILNHSIILASNNDQSIVNSIGIITGGASGKWTFCLDSNVDVYLTGEISEHDWHDAQEAGVHMMAGGHHATEKLGIQNLMKNTSCFLSSLNTGKEISTFFIDSDNPA